MNVYTWNIVHKPYFLFRKLFFFFELLGNFLELTDVVTMNCHCLLRAYFCIPWGKSLSFVKQHQGFVGELFF